MGRFFVFTPKASFVLTPKALQNIPQGKRAQRAPPWDHDSNLIHEPALASDRCQEPNMSAAIKPVSITGAGATESSPQLKTENSELKTAFANSRRIYIDGDQPGVRVPFREIDQNPTRNFKNELEENPPVRVYDTSGPYGDPSMAIDVRSRPLQLPRDSV